MTNPIIELKGLKKSFGSKVVHDGVSLNIEKGEIIALFGGSGTGKSVALRCIIGLDKPDAGAILFHGQDISKLSETALTPIRKRIAYVFQNGALFDSMSVEDNLAYPLIEHTKINDAEIKEKIQKLLAMIGNGWQRITFACQPLGRYAKTCRPGARDYLGAGVILYDEPTAGLDPQNTKNLLELIKKLQAMGTTGIL